MKKLIFFTTLFFQIASCLSQDKDFYGTVYYRFQPNNNTVSNSKEVEQHVKDLFKSLNDYAADVKFKMDFFNTTSIFTIKDDLEIESKPFAKVIANNIVGSGSFYCDLERDLLYRKVDRGDFIIKLQPSKKKWVLSQEMKYIKDYKCYKAITSVTNKNATGEYTFEVIAWYAPDIPVPFGPKEFNGLPGLIMELKDTHFTFYVDKIELFPKEKPIIKPFKGKIITEEKYRERIREMMGGFIKR